MFDSAAPLSATEWLHPLLALLDGGVLDLPLWSLIIWVLLSCHLTLLAVTLYLHRAQAHRSIALHPLLSHLFRFWLWLTTGMNTREWVAVHRKHHAHCETELDPHSPQIHGIRTVLLQGAELYREEAADRHTLTKYGLGTPEDWVERKLYTPYPYLGVALLLIAELVLLGFSGVAIFALQMLCIPVLAAGVINGVGHYWGYRNYHTDDTATNIVPLGLLICGEELHNNHHAYPSSAKFSQRRWEIDLGWLYLKLFNTLGLAKIRRLAPVPVFDGSKELMDLETVTAIISSKLHVFENYTRRVMNPTHRDALHNAVEPRRSLLASARNELFAPGNMLDANGRTRIERAFAASEALQTVYEFRERLQAIWDTADLSPDGLLASMQEWCRQAEETGIQQLQEFAEALHGYSLKPATVITR